MEKFEKFALSIIASLTLSVLGIGMAIDNCDSRFNIGFVLGMIIGVPSFIWFIVTWNSEKEE